MEFDGEEMLEPVSPNAQFMKSSALSLTIIAVLEFHNPIQDSINRELIRDVFLRINTRFSSIMVTDKKALKKWKRVHVNVEDHIKYPIFPGSMTADYYDGYLTEYLSSISMEELPENQPMWEIHIVKYPTTAAPGGSVIFKLHHSLGDGYSLMGALLSCLQRMDNLTIPLTFPSRRPAAAAGRGCAARCFRRITRFFMPIVYTTVDMGSGIWKTAFMRDDESPIKSGVKEIQQTDTTTVTFSIDRIKQIKTRLNGTINDVISGVIFYGTRLYMQNRNEASCRATTTSLLVLNTRALDGYKSVDEMIRPNSRMPWGNRFTFLHIPVPKLTTARHECPISFVRKAQKIIKRQRNSRAVYLRSHLLNIIAKLGGAEAISQYLHRTINGTSIGISNLIGPVEEMAVAEQHVKGLYYFVTGLPQSLVVTMISYAGTLRVAITVEKGFIDPGQYKSCIEYAFEAIYADAFKQFE